MRRWSQAYREAFRRDTFHLLSEGHKRARSAIGTSTDEPEISSRIADAIEDLLSELPPRFERYTVQPERPQRSNARFGAARRRIDIAIGRVRGRETAMFSFEAKRLRKPRHTLRHYVGSDGLLLFVAGEYAQEDPEAGMLGYVQDSTIGAWYERFKAEVTSPQRVALALIGRPQSLSDTSFSYPILSTRHSREGKPPIRIFHLFLDCA